jgi:FkbM family methyltransferase
MSISDRRLGAYRRLAHVRPTIVSVGLKKLLQIGRIPVETNLGIFWIDPVSHLGQTLLHRKVHEPFTVEALQSVLHSGATFVDLGSNEGYFSIIASKLVGRTGMVYAVEPQQRLQAVLQRNIDMNQARNITVRSCAVSDQVGTQQLHLAPDTNTGSSGFYRATRYHTRVESVDTVTLSGFFKKEHIDHCDLLKIDIEGHEHEAVLGSSEVFQSGVIKALALEVHHEILRRRGLDAKEITEFLARCGYHLDGRFPETSMWVRH